ncbi:DUF2187 domain-containing protein [Lapidilactobacillus mulanensis]|uniref:DUF2187 domain-containing protein n=1 Tax=Lapidilactobacillus mulanensis TaxID=2485999 RepID=A0ABW4DPB6_9LACO|nr:DUF2187 domain-containing protein [Lapidilactobacillus mulanensis]
MNISEIHVGDQLRGHVKEDMEQDFIGEVEKIYENSVLMQIIESDEIDKSNVIELNNKIVVSCHSVSPVKPLKKAN